MDRRTQAVIAATITVLGLGVASLGFLVEESGVRYVEEVMDAPAAHQTGVYTLIGEIQPPSLESAQGTTVNPEWDDAITYGERVTADDGTAVLRTTTLAATQTQAGTIDWTMTVHERPVDQSGPATVVDERHWTGTGLLFQVDSFETDRTVWAVYQGNVERLDRKPSQLEGRLAAPPDVPDGALLFQVDVLTQQCSSKFIPESVRDDFVDTDGDGYVDSRADSG